MTLSIMWLTISSETIMDFPVLLLQTGEAKLKQSADYIIFSFMSSLPYTES